ncbi:peroxiredoxin [Patescibacteria group bacterium]|nr:peroxiredoxin [Patescibacteria group bacterium]
MPASKDLTIGDIAPLFVLPDQEGRKIALADFKEKKNVVLIFYPGDMTPGCTMQLCSVRDVWSKFAKRDAIVFGVNHAGAESHQAFVEKYRFPFQLLIDPGKKVSAAYGAIRSLFKVKVIRRTVVVIDKEGRIAYFRRGMPKDADILKAIPKG